MGLFSSWRNILHEQHVSYVCLLAHRRHDDEHATVHSVAVR